MTPRQRRLAVFLVFFGALAAWGRADSQIESNREGRREQIRRSRTHLAEALEQFESGALDSAETGLRAILEDDPNEADAHFHLARILLARDDTTAAQALLEQGVERAPLSTRLKLLLARLQIAGGAAGQAASLLDEVLVIRPRDGETLYLRGLAHLAAGDSLSALETWRRSLEVNLEGHRP